ncbi:hypothetical protein C8R42DRAFT_642920 [Lentinula raphanica]|nr:hypothetical protein C8R42DRAFT_642920 [Lentinula raphanica]
MLNKEHPKWDSPVEEHLKWDSPCGTTQVGQPIYRGYPIWAVPDEGYPIEDIPFKKGHPNSEGTSYRDIPAKCLSLTRLYSNLALSLQLGTLLQNFVPAPSALASEAPSQLLSVVSSSAASLPAPTSTAPPCNQTYRLFFFGLYSAASDLSKLDLSLYPAYGAKYKCTDSNQCVLIKPDMLGTGSTKAQLWLDVIDGCRHPLVFGYHCTLQPNDDRVVPVKDDRPLVSIHESLEIRILVLTILSPPSANFWYRLSTAVHYAYRAIRSGNLVEDCPDSQTKNDSDSLDSLSVPFSGFDPNPKSTLDSNGQTPFSFTGLYTPLELHLSSLSSTSSISNRSSSTFIFTPSKRTSQT